MSVDDRRWEAALNLLETLYAQKGYEASLEAADDIQEITQGKLMELHHAPYTKTPSPPGAAPAAISGRLAASITVTGDPGSLSAFVGPTTEASSYNGPYGRIQELGGGSHGNPMTWFEDGSYHEAYYRKLPERPYLKPSTEELIDSGRLTEIYVEKWIEAQVEATG